MTRLTNERSSDELRAGCRRRVVAGCNAILVRAVLAGCRRGLSMTSIGHLGGAAAPTLNGTEELAQL